MVMRTGKSSKLELETFTNGMKNQPIFMILPSSRAWKRVFHKRNQLMLLIASLILEIQLPLITSHQQERLPTILQLQDT
jgi:hypothetical protein